MGLKINIVLFVINKSVYFSFIISLYNIWDIYTLYSIFKLHLADTFIESVYIVLMSMRVTWDSNKALALLTQFFTISATGYLIYFAILKKLWCVVKGQVYFLMMGAAMPALQGCRSCVSNISMRLDRCWYSSAPYILLISS